MLSERESWLPSDFEFVLETVEQCPQSENGLDPTILYPVEFKIEMFSDRQKNRTPTNT